MGQVDSQLGSQTATDGYGYQANQTPKSSIKEPQNLATIYHHVKVRMPERSDVKLVTTRQTMPLL